MIHGSRNFNFNQNGYRNDYYKAPGKIYYGDNIRKKKIGKKFYVPYTSTAHHVSAAQIEVTAIKFIYSRSHLG